MLKYLLYWLGIFILCMLLYIAKDPIKKIGKQILVQLIPGHAIENTQGELVFVRSYDGHFYINAEIGEETVKFLVDTGASHTTISLSLARNIGVDINSLEFNRIVATANGRTRVAMLVADKINIGSATIYDIPIAISDSLHTPLLGISSLNHFKYYRFAGDKLYLGY